MYTPKCHRYRSYVLYADMLGKDSILLNNNIYYFQSINQISIAPISPAKPGSVARQPNQCSTAKSRKQFCNISRSRGMQASMGEKAKSKRGVLRCFSKVATEMAERTDSGRYPFIIILYNYIIYYFMIQFNNLSI